MSRSVSENLLASRYQLLEPIGTGGMAEVHRAWDTVLRRHVAIKLFQPGFDAAGAKRFDNEVRALAQLSHPGLVSVYDADTHGGTPFVVLQLVQGCTLRELVDQGPLQVDRVRRIGGQLADALAHVHAHGLVHRDVKPSNILLDHEDNAYLADFGLAHLTGATRLTRTDQLVGTAAYLAPEQVLGEEVGHPTDVYALGLVLLECVTGRREYEGGDVEAAIARLHRPPVVPEQLPTDFGTLLSQMTALSADDRPTAQDCAQALLDDPAPVARAIPAATGDTTTPATGDTASITRDTALITPPRRETRPSWKALVASAGALVGAFAITTAATSGDGPVSSAPTSSAPPASSAQPFTSAPQVAAGTPDATADQGQQGDPGQRAMAGQPLEVTEQAAGSPQAAGSAQAANTPQVTTTAAPPAATTRPVAVERPQPTTRPVEPTTTNPQEPTTPVTPTSESSPDPATPSPPPSEGDVGADS